MKLNGKRGGAQEEFKQFETIPCYRQGLAARPLYISYPWVATLESFVGKKKVPKQWRIAGYFYSDLVTNFIAIDSFEAIAHWYVEENRKDHRFIDNLYHTWLTNEVKIFKKAVVNLRKKNLQDLDNDALIQEWKTFDEIYLPVWQQSIFLDSFDLCGVDILHEELQRLHVSLTEDEITLLTSPNEPSWLQREEIGLGRIFEKYITGHHLEKDLLNAMPFEDMKKIHPAFVQDIIAHAQEYYWIAIDYACVVDKKPEDFYEKLCHVLANSAERERFFHIQRSLDMARTKKEELIRNKNLSPDVQGIFSMFITLMQMRDHRKTYNQMGSSVVSRFVQEAHRRTRIPILELERLWFMEIEYIFSLDKEDIQILKKRSHCAIVAKEDRSVVWIYGRDAKKFHDAASGSFSNMPELKGMPAQKGFVRGVARLVMNQGDFSKMQPGDILIAPNTRPEYLPVMKIAAAIVTEEGGITSHAAIVSRELQKPSIVGVQGITLVLKDGDRIEVDANNGIVRKI